ncbi:putative TPR repeat methyltransferase [Rhodoblastus sphagnicola]|uniref:class I SAM-dependent DNA methyltransferase n=1 Tax=Rhodoblastus sphagnicola TaxID=333368 RepID=UPI0017C308DF|nr:methyltransferase domain-containing protein [Rhodoblastus sphagnicola]MBB4198760.1 putative TPR repeat methyltransferase [Rhodoblastus sphagnicola]
MSADRRYEWGQGALAAGDAEGARDLFAQALECAPNWAAAWFGLAQALDRLDRRVEAREAYAKTLNLDPGDAHGAALGLARLGGPAPAAAPRAYVKTLFDQYAARFDTHLVTQLAYRGPEILCGAIARADADRRFAHVLDLGCGAGLFAAAIRPHAAKISGVDLSPAMIEQARAKGIYDRLAAADLTEFLAAEPSESADLAVAADVFVYIGDLGDLFAQVARTLSLGGLFAFTAQSGPSQGFGVGADLRFRHSEAYLRDLACAHGFDVAALFAVSARRDRGIDVPGWAAVLRKNRA